MTPREVEIVKSALVSFLCNLNDVNDALGPTDRPFKEQEVEAVLEKIRQNPKNLVENFWTATTISLPESKGV